MIDASAGRPPARGSSGRSPPRRDPAPARGRSARGTRIYHGTEWREDVPLSVVVFSGGRGSSVLSRELIAHPGIDPHPRDQRLRRRDVDRGGAPLPRRRARPVDFRKNASHLAAALRACPEQDIGLLACLPLALHARGSTGDPARHRRTGPRPPGALRGRARRDRQAVRLRRLRDRQRRLRRIVPARRPPLQRRGGRLLLPCSTCRAD